jgi:hypothetical protein
VQNFVLKKFSSHAPPQNQKKITFFHGVQLEKECSYVLIEGLPYPITRGRTHRCCMLTPHSLRSTGYCLVGPTLSFEIQRKFNKLNGMSHMTCRDCSSAHDSRVDDTISNKDTQEPCAGNCNSNNLKELMDCVLRRLSPPLKAERRSTG